jgi:phosphoglycolate phosphatase
MAAAILFDLDGTLTDAKPGIIRCIQYALSELGYAPPHPETLHWCLGPPLHNSFAQLLQTSDNTVIQQALFFYRQQYVASGMFENTLYPQIPETLKALRARGYSTFVATSKPQVYATEIIEHFNLASLFDCVYGSELDGRRSEKADLIHHILQIEQLSPEATVMVGDREHDIIGAKHNQVAAIGVTYGYGTLQELQTQGANWIVAAPGEIPGLLGFNDFAKHISIEG